MFTHEQLARRIVPAQIPSSEEWRRTWGRTLTPSSIEVAIRNAEAGCMAEISDLEYESVRLDPHASGVLVKRFGSISTLEWQVQPKKGPGINQDLAEELADFCRGQLEQVDELEERLYELCWAEFFGRAAAEVHWTYAAGTGTPWRLRSIEWINPRRIWFGPERELRIVDTWNTVANFQPTGVALRDWPGKFLSWSPRLFCGYPEQEGLGPRMLYWLFFKRFSWRMRMKLTELFGIPWRIVEADKDTSPNRDALLAAQESVQQLGDDNCAVMPPGLKLNVVLPGEGSADIFQLTNDDVDKQVSKLVLGNTGTTEASEANRASSIVQLSEQELLIARSATALSGRVTKQLLRTMVEVNWGPQYLSHCPTFWMRSQPQRDVQKELANINTVVGMGIPVAQEQVRELTGLRPLQDGETPVESPAAAPSGQTGGLEDGGVDQAAANALRDLVPRLVRTLERLERGEVPRRPFPAGE